MGYLDKSGLSFAFKNMYCSFTVAIVCSTLNEIANGLIAYSSDTVSPFDFGTTATYSCDEGFFLEGNSTQTCEGDGSRVDGVWSGSAPVCAGTLIARVELPTQTLVSSPLHTSSGSHLMIILE